MASRSRSRCRATRSTAASTWCRRTASAPACCSTSRSPRTSRCPICSPMRAAIDRATRPRRPPTPSGSRHRLDIRTPSVATEAGTLSGGNQQKVVLAKWLSMQPQRDDLRRADARHRRRRQERDLRADARARRRRRRHPDDLQRHGGGDRRQRPHRRDARRRHQRLPRAQPSSASRMCCSSPSASGRTESTGNVQEERSRPSHPDPRRRRGGRADQPALPVADQPLQHRQPDRPVRPVLARRGLRHHHRRHRAVGRLDHRAARRHLHRPDRQCSACPGAWRCRS